MTEPDVKLIDEYWQRYHDKVLLPNNAGVVQIVETRRAFYAGCQALFVLVTEKAADFTDEQAEAHFKIIDTEIQWFRDLLKEGQA